MLIVSPLRGRTKEPDEACAQAVELARRAAEDLGGAAMIGDHLSVTADGDRVVTHTFRCLEPAYRGWCWAVTVTRASRAKNVTVSESVLVPGPEAILAPDWVPWRERLLPGDLGVGDLLPAPPDDPRLVAAVALEGDDGLADWGETAWALPGAEPEDLVPVQADVAADGPAAPGADDAGPDSGDPAVPGAEDMSPGAGAPEAGAADGAEAGAADGAEAGAAGAPEAGAADGPGAVNTGAEPGTQPAAAVDGGTGEGPAETVAVRARVMSAAGRDDAALRWYTSEHGPKSALAHAAPGLCAGCGFFVRLAGPLGRVFGACANEYAPDDGRVVSVDHGCGAHSEAVFPPPAGQPLRPVIDELGYDLVDMPGVSVEETVFEPLDHN